MRKPRIRVLHPRDIGKMYHILKACIPTDAEVETGWRLSNKSVPNFRIRGTTDEIVWYVDIYAGQFYYIQVQGLLAETRRSIPAVVGCLRRMLGQRVR